MKGNQIIKGIALLLLAVCCILQTGSAQNLNTPNKTGPLGIQVNTFTGNVFISRPDLVVVSRGFNLSALFYYNSFDYNQDIGFGKGWRMIYSIRYQIDSLNNITITWGDGRQDIYQYNGSGYNAPSGIFSVLTRYQPDKYLLTQTDGVQFYFDFASNKRVSKIAEPNGNNISFSYNDTLLTGITSAAGQTIILSYYSNGHLQTLTDALTVPARILQYTYDSNGDLIQVTDPLGGKYRYSYLVNGPMKSMTDKNNNTVDIIYYPDITCSELVGCNKRISFSYDTTQLSTTCTDYLSSGNNQVNTYKYKKSGTSTWLSAVTGNCCGFNMTFTYDQMGNKTQETDANGNITKYDYDTRGNLVAITDALNQVQRFSYSADFNKVTAYTDEKGFVTSLTYDSKGNLTQLTEPGNLNYTITYAPNGDILTSSDPAGNVYTYTYDAFGNPLSVSGPNGYHASLEYDARGNLLSFTDANGNKKLLEYDILNRLKKITDPLNHLRTYSYDSTGNLLSYTNEKNQVTQLQYDASNRPVKIVDAGGNASILYYDAMDNIIAVKDALGNTSSYGYDTRNRLTSITDPLGNISGLGYDAAGNITALSMPNGRSAQISYDAKNQIKTIGDNSGNLRTYSYDPAGKITSITNANGSTLSIQYDDKNRPISVTDALGNTSHFSYDNIGRIVSATDRNGLTHSYTYNALGQIKTVKDHLNNTITVSYDNWGNLVSLTDQRNNVTTYLYDQLNRVTRVTYPDTRFMDLSYDNTGNITSRKMPDGSVITYAYDSLNRVITKNMPDGNIFSYSYDALGRIKTATNNSGTATFTYDGLSRVIAESFNGRTIAYSYNTTGRSQSTMYPDSTIVTKNYDTRNRITSILKNGQLLVSYEYDNAGNLIKKSFANGLVTNLQYDAANRLTGLSTGALQNTSISYDNEDNKTAVTRLNDPSKSETFTYDANYRVSDYKKGGSIHNIYTYDALGNRTSANQNSAITNYSINNLNQITSSSGALSINYVYDNNGNLLYDGHYFKTYDAEGRLLKDSASPANIIRYQYDAFNRRVQKNINGTISNYTYAGIMPIEERNGSGAVKNKTYFLNFMSPIVNEKNNIPYYYHNNDLNSVELMTDQQGNLAEKYDYDVYGKLAISDASGTPLNGSLTGNRFGFTGQTFDSLTGATKFFFREYNTETGLFNQRDPIGYADGMGMYQYVHNNPANGVDALGLKDCPPETYFGPANAEQWILLVTSSGFSNITSITPFLADEASLLKAFGNAGANMLKPGFLQNLLNSPAGSTLLGIGLTPFNAKATFNTARDLGTNWSTNSYGQNTDGVISLGSGAVSTGTGLATTGNFVVGAYETGSLGGGAAVAGETLTGSFLLPLAGGLAIFGVVNEVTKATTGRSIAEHGENMRIPLYTDGAEYFNGGRKAYYDTKALEDMHSLNGTKPKWDRARAKIEAIENGTYRKPNTDCPQNNGGGNNRPSPGGGGNYPGGKVPIVQSGDPNAIIGPDGQPDKHWVSVNDRMNYTILYENNTSASAPAKFVRITSPVELKQDAGSFQLGSFGFNNQTFNIPNNAAAYYQRLDCRDSLGLYVDITAGYDVNNKQFFWEFQSIDPVTLLPTVNPSKGFLSLQDSTSKTKGHAFVNFSTKPITSAVTLDTIGARANIVFDGNDTIPTNIASNTIDAFAPTTHLNTLPANSHNPIALSWTGADDNNGSGLKYYTLYVSNDGTNFSILKTGMTRTDTSINLAEGTTYFFFVLGTDSVGNTEALRGAEVKSVFVSAGSALPVNWLYFRGNNQGRDNLLEWATASEQNTKKFILERSLDATNFVSIGTVAAAGNSNTVTSYHYTDYNVDKLGSNNLYYRLKQVDIDDRFKYSTVVKISLDSKGPKNSMLYPNPTSGNVTVVIGDKALLGTQAMVYDEAGRALFSLKISSMNQAIILDGYAHGIYYIRLSNKEILKVVKQ